jgi:hypothetical protein
MDNQTKKKLLKKNTYKIIISDFKTGGFCINFFEPYEDYTAYLLKLDDDDCCNIKYYQYSKDEVVVDIYNTWRVKKS